MPTDCCLRASMRPFAENAGGKVMAAMAGC
jgi:hypothetical protein